MNDHVATCYVLRANVRRADVRTCDVRTCERAMCGRANVRRAHVGEHRTPERLLDDSGPDFVAAGVEVGPCGDVVAGHGEGTVDGAEQADRGFQALVAAVEGERPEFCGLEGSEGAREEESFTARRPGRGGSIGNLPAPAIADGADHDAPIVPSDHRSDR